MRPLVTQFRNISFPAPVYMPGVTTCSESFYNIRSDRLGPPPTQRDREFLSDNLLVRIHFICVMIRWTGLAPWEFEFPFPCSLTSTFLEHSGIRRDFAAKITQKFVALSVETPLCSYAIAYRRAYVQSPFASRDPGHVDRRRERNVQRPSTTSGPTASTPHHNCV